MRQFWKAVTLGLSTVVHMIHTKRECWTFVESLPWLLFWNVTRGALWRFAFGPWSQVGSTRSVFCNLLLMFARPPSGSQARKVSKTGHFFLIPHSFFIFLSASNLQHQGYENCPLTWQVSFHWKSENIQHIRLSSQSASIRVLFAWTKCRPQRRRKTKISKG